MHGMPEQQCSEAYMIWRPPTCRTCLFTMEIDSDGFYCGLLVEQMFEPTLGKY
jgi:hypothetical protein